MDIPPHLVANNKDVLELAKVRPSSTKTMLKVDGISVVKVKRIGEQMLKGNPKLFFNCLCYKNTTPETAFQLISTISHTQVFEFNLHFTSFKFCTALSWFSQTFTQSTNGSFRIGLIVQLLLDSICIYSFSIRQRSTATARRTTQSRITSSLVMRSMK